ncbi:MAG: linear amide C-N hydrolase [Bacillota bacterium]
MVRSGKRLIKYIGLMNLIVLLLCILVVDSLACSEVFINKGGMVKVSARNFDFNNAGDGFIRFSPVGTAGQAQYTPQNCQPLKWTSKYASITFNLSIAKSQSPKDGEYGAGVDGINQAGLKVGTYFLASSVFPEQAARNTLDIGSLMQYLLDNCKSVDEALADLASGRYRVTSTPTGGVEIKLHLFLHDVQGVSAIVEFIDGKIKVTYNPAIPVLTNNTYGQSIEYLKRYSGFGGDLAIPGSVDSLDRFVRGVYYWENLAIPKNSIQAINYGFAAIQILSESPGFRHGCTLWTIVTDLDNKKISFRTLSSPTLASIDLNKLSATVKKSHSINILRTDLSGDISDMFQQD